MAGSTRQARDGWQCVDPGLKDEHRRYVYLWADNIHFGVRMADAAQCVLVVIGTTADGKKELLALSDGYRENEAS